MAVFLVLVAAGLTGVLIAAQQEVKRARSLAHDGRGNGAMFATKEALLLSLTGSQLLGAVVSQVGILLHDLHRRLQRR
jgi:hypothetical protein